jgi:CelD/BcsL family acetyltransferase involved in cellulose biosynthesis
MKEKGRIFMTSNPSLLTTTDEVESLSTSWSAFQGTITLPMQQHSWINACVAAFSPSQKLQIVVHGTPERPLAIAPLVLHRAGEYGQLEMAGERELSEPVDLIWADGQSLQDLADALARVKRPIFVDRVPEDSPSVSALKKAFRRRGVALCRETVGYPFIPLGERWRKPEDNLSTRRSSDLRRARRKAEKIGRLKTEILAPRPDELDPLLDRAFAIEANSWKGREKTALAADPIRGAFFRHFANAASKEGVFRVCFLSIGDRAAAMQLAVECSNQFWLLKIGYDEEFAHCSPGNLLLCNSIQYAAEKGLTSYDFLGRVEPWTAIWTETERRCVSLRLYPANLRGISALAKQAGRSLYARMWSAVRREP